MAHRPASSLARAVCGASLLWCSCGRGGGDGDTANEAAAKVQPRSGGTLRVAVLQDIEEPSWIAGMQETTQQFYEHVVPPLVRFDAGRRRHPYAASEMYDSGFEIAFALRRLRWSDGAPVVPDDYRLTAKLLADPRSRSPERIRMDLVHRIEAIGNGRGLRIEFGTPYARRIPDSFIWPSPQHAWHDSIDPGVWAPRLACGPFRIARISPMEMVLVRHDSSGFAPALLDTVHVVRRTVATAAREFAAGRLDVVDDPPASFLEGLRPGDAKIVALVGRSYTFVGWNLRDARFREIEVRRALAQAVDTQALIRRWTAGQGVPARGPLVPVQALVDTGTVLRHDRRAAGRALAAAGFVDTDRDGIRDRRGARLAFHILAPDTDSIRIGIAHDVARDLRDVGAAVEVSVVRLDEFLARLSGGHFEAFVGEWYPDPGLDLDPVWRSTSTDRYNFGRFADAEVDRLLGLLWSEEPAGGRDQVMAALQARIYGLQPYLFLFQRPHFLVLDPAVQGAQPEVTQPFWNLPAWWLAERTPRRRRRPSRTLARRDRTAHLAGRRGAKARVRRLSCCP